MEVTKSKKVLNVFSLVMINVIAVDSLRSLPVSAEYGFSLVFFYILGGLFFFIPTALVAAELATGWPQTGGIYIWLREAFGKKSGFLVIWLQWLYNVVWYPTIMSFLAATLSYIFAPQLANNKAYMLTMILLLFWGATFANWFGMKISSWVSTVAALIGTLLPMLFIIVLAIFWLIGGHPLQIQFTSHEFFPTMNLGSLGLLTVVLFGLIGMEMSAVHAGDVKNPQKDYPKALFISAILIISTLVLGSLAIAMVVPVKSIHLASGLMDAFQAFFQTFHIPWMTPVIAVLIIVGGLGTVSAWVIGPTKGLMIAAEDDAAPRFFKGTNKYAVPTKILVLQGVIMTVLSLFFVLMPSVNAAFSLLSTITGQIALLVYVGIFSAAIRLRFTKPEAPRAYRIPGGKIGMGIVAGFGILTSVTIFVFGFFPPSQIQVGSTKIYEFILISGVILICLPPLFMMRKRIEKNANNT
jgi:putative glutamate/gamma-aminobutyrate antiporter